MLAALPGILEQQGTGEKSYKLAFNGTSSTSVDLGTSVSDNVRNISFWFKPNISITSSTSTTSLMTNDHNSPGLDFFGLNFFSGVLKFSRYNSGGSNVSIDSNSNAWKLGEWYFISVDINSTTGTSMYINGVKQSSTIAETDAILTSSFPTYLGGNVGYNIRYFNGDIKEVKFFTESLSQEEIISEMTYHPTGLELGLKEYFNFPEGSGVTTTGINGTIATLTTASIWEETPYTDYNHITLSNSSSEYIDLGNTIINGARGFSFIFSPEVEINSSSPSSALISRLEFPFSNPLNQFEILFFNGVMSFSYAPNTASNPTGTVSSFSNLWEVGKQYYIHVQLDDVNGMEMFVDNIEQTTKNGSTGIYTGVISTSTTNLFVNGRPEYGNRAMSFNIKHLKVWDDSRTLSEITNDNTLIPNGTDSDLRAYIPFLQLEGNKVYDFRDNYEGTINTLGDVDDSWEITYSQLQLNNRVLHYDTTNINSYSGSGTSITDLSDNTADGSLINGITFNPVTKGLVFNGTNQYIQSLLSYSLGASAVNDFTVFVCIKTNNKTSVGGSSRLPCSNYQGTPVPFNMQLNSGTGILQGVTRGSSSVIVVSGTTPLDDGLKKVITYRKKGNNYSVFVDGNMEGLGSSSVGTCNVTNNLVFGVLNNLLNQGFFDGEFYQGIIYNQGLTNKEILDSSKNLLNK